MSPFFQVAGHKVGCVVVDEPHGLLWVGDRDGMVAAYDCPQGALLGEWRAVMCNRAAPRYQFQAFSAGSVTAMARAATGALWAGSARGSLRVFEFDGAAILCTFFVWTRRHSCCAHCCAPWLFVCIGDDVLV